MSDFDFSSRHPSRRSRHRSPDHRGRAGESSTDEALFAQLPPTVQSVAAMQHLVGNRAVAGMVTAQRTATTDLTDATTNRRHVKHETYPGLLADLKTVNTRVLNRVNTYKAAHGGAEPAPGSRFAQAAAGLKTFSENLIEAADGKWAEAGEMARLAQKGRTPIPARNNVTDADIQYEKAAGTTGVEVKAVNSAHTGQVTAVLTTADAQLANRNVAWHKALVWIAHEENHWPGIFGFPGRTTDAQVQADVAAQLNGMNLLNTDVVRIQMVRVPPGHPSAGHAVDVRATGGHGVWVVAVTHHH